MTETDICNLALDRIGEPMISDFAENSPNAITCRRHYEAVRDSLLRSHPWNFATGRAQLTADSTAPEFGYSYSYQLPVDCLRELTLNGVEAKKCEASYTIEGRKLLTDASEARITYVKKVEDPNDFDSLFSDVLAFRLAAAIAVSVTGSESKRDGMEQMAALRLNDASFVDANETSPRVLSPLRSGRRSRSNDFRDYGNAPDTGVDLDNGEDGANGWTPTFAVVSDGDRRVLWVTGWTGGAGTEPDAGYLGASGIVASAATAVDIRGIQGEIGPFGTNLHIGLTAPEDPEGFPLWWKSDIGLLMIWYDDGTSEQWVSAVGAGPVGPSAYQSYLNTTADDPPLSEEAWSSPLSEIADLADFGSGSATDGYVATADGAGGVAWEAAASPFDPAAPGPIGGTTPDAGYFTTLESADSVAISDMSDTWNDSGTTFTGLKLNITDTASNAASLIFDFQVGGVSKIHSNKSGHLYSEKVMFYDPGGVSERYISYSGGWVGANYGFRVVASDLEMFAGGIHFGGYGSGSANQFYDAHLTAPANDTLQLGTNHATDPTAQKIKAHDVTTGTGADLWLSGGTGSSANGVVRFGTHAAIGAETVTGYVTIRDDGGTLRKVAIVS